VIYISDEQSCKEEVKQIWPYIEDSLVIFNELFDEYIENSGYDKDKVKQARIITFTCVVIEKIILMNLYARNPLLLMSDDKITKKDLVEDLDHKKFNRIWLHNKSNEFISPSEMFLLLNEILVNEGEDEILDLKDDFEFIKKIRNKYLHSFPLDVPPNTFYLVRYNIFFLLFRLLDVLPKFLDLISTDVLKEIGFDEGKIETIKKFNEDKELAEYLEGFEKLKKRLDKCTTDSEKRKLMREQIYGQAFLNQDVPVFDYNGDQKTAFDGNEEIPQTEKRDEVIARQEVLIECPHCAREELEDTKTGYIGISCEGVEHNTDGDGDAEWWNEPIHADLLFDYYFCISCGAFSSESYILENLEYGEIFENLFGIDWDINFGVTGYYLSSDGFELQT